MSSARDDTPAAVTEALEQVAAGDGAAGKRLLALVYGELKRLAASKLAGQARGHTLQPTALVHEAWMRLLGGPAGQAAYRDRGHFFSAAGSAMRSILVDHARRKHADKRGGGARRVGAELPGSGLDGLSVQGEGGIALDAPERVLAVHEALERLVADFPRAAQVVELLFFAGLTAEEAAAVLDVSERTVKRDWRFARAWLSKAMDGA